MTIVSKSLIKMETESKQLKKRYLEMENSSRLGVLLYQREMAEYLLVTLTITIFKYSVLMANFYSILAPKDGEVDNSNILKEYCSIIVTNTC